MKSSLEGTGKKSGALEFPAVAIGASAGGVQAVGQLPARLPWDFPGAVFVVIHVQPDRESFLDRVLQRSSALPVTHVKEGMVPEAGHVYVGAPGYHSALTENGVLHIFKNEKINYSRPSIEPLYESVARYFGSRSALVVLTGLGSNGASVLPKAKALGARILVQDPEEAPLSSMPKAAIATGAADRVLKIRDMACALTDFANHVLDSKEPQSENPSGSADVSEKNPNVPPTRGG